MNTNIVMTNQDITKFPKKLQRLAQVFTEKIYFCDLKSACEFADLNYSSVRTMLSREKKKGNNFWMLVENMRKEKLLAYKPFVDNKMIDRALTGTNKDRELFYKLTGDINTGSSNQFNIQINNECRFPVAKSKELPPDVIDVE